jgi:hypothetical protein
MSTQFYTLKQLKERVNSLIEQQGEQLMEEIDRIVHDHVSKKLTSQEQLSLVLHLCDAVRYHFPSDD